MQRRTAIAYRPGAWAQARQCVGVITKAQVRRGLQSRWVTTGSAPKSTCAASAGAKDNLTVISSGRAACMPCSIRLTAELLPALWKLHRSPARRRAPSRRSFGNSSIFGMAATRAFNRVLEVDDPCIAFVGFEFFELVADERYGVFVVNHGTATQ